MMILLPLKKNSFDNIFAVSTLLQWFTRVRLHYPHLMAYATFSLAAQYRGF